MLGKHECSLQSKRDQHRRKEGMLSHLILIISHIKAGHRGLCPLTLSIMPIQVLCIFLCLFCCLQCQDLHHVGIYMKCPATGRCVLAALGLAFPIHVLAGGWCAQKRKQGQLKGYSRLFLWKVMTWSHTSGRPCPAHGVCRIAAYKHQLDIHKKTAV